MTSMWDLNIKSNDKSNNKSNNKSNESLYHMSAINSIPQAKLNCVSFNTRQPACQSPNSNQNSTSCNSSSNIDEQSGQFSPNNATSSVQNRPIINTTIETLDSVQFKTAMELIQKSLFVLFCTEAKLEKFYMSWKNILEKFTMNRSLNLVFDFANLSYLFLDMLHLLVCDKLHKRLQRNSEPRSISTYADFVLADGVLDTEKYAEYAADYIISLYSTHKYTICVGDRNGVSGLFVEYTDTNKELRRRELNLKINHEIVVYMLLQSLIPKLDKSQKIDINLMVVMPELIGLVDKALYGATDAVKTDHVVIPVTRCQIGKWAQMFENDNINLRVWYVTVPPIKVIGNTGYKYVNVDDCLLISAMKGIIIRIRTGNEYRVCNSITVRPPKKLVDVCTDFRNQNQVNKITGFEFANMEILADETPLEGYNFNGFYPSIGVTCDRLKEYIPIKGERINFSAIQIVKSGGMDLYIEKPNDNRHGESKMVSVPTRLFFDVGQVIACMHEIGKMTTFPFYCNPSSIIQLNNILRFLFGCIKK